MNAITEQADQNKISDSGRMEAELYFGKFMYNPTTKIKGQNREQVNSAYYQGNPFDIRLRP